MGFKNLSIIPAGSKGCAAAVAAPAETDVMTLGSAAVLSGLGASSPLLPSTMMIRITVSIKKIPYMSTEGRTFAHNFFRYR